MRPAIISVSLILITNGVVERTFPHLMNESNENNQYIYVKNNVQ